MSRGPTTGAIHSASSVNPNGTTEQYGVVARAAGQVVSGKDYSLHLGGDAQFLIQPPHNLVAGSQTLTLSDRPELRIDPTTLVSTGALANVSAAQVYSAEAAGTYGPLYFQGEYFWFNVERNAVTGLPPIGAPNLHFQGGYAEASYVLTGESHPYNSSQRLLRRHCAGESVLVEQRRLGRMGDRRPVLARSISTISSLRPTASPAAGRTSIRWR